MPPGYELTFADDFDRLDLDNGESAEPDGTWLTYWHGWGVRHLKGNHDRALKADGSFRGTGGPTLAEHGIVLHEVTEDGTLKLYGRETPRPIRIQFHNAPYLGGMISGERSFAQHLGYWEMRLRINRVSRGHHWAVWLLPDDGSWPPEIDLLEVIGSNPGNGSDAQKFFFNSIGPDHGEITRIDPPNGIDAWYTLGFLWTPADLRWYLDGEEVRHRPNDLGDQRFYFLITPEIAGRWPGQPDAFTKWPMEIEVDYVRVYQGT